MRPAGVEKRAFEREATEVTPVLKRPAAAERRALPATDAAEEPSGLDQHPAGSPLVKRPAGKRAAEVVLARPAGAQAVEVDKPAGTSLLQRPAAAKVQGLAGQQAEERREQAAEDLGRQEKKRRGLNGQGPLPPLEVLPPPISPVRPSAPVRPVPAAPARAEAAPATEASQKRPARTRAFFTAAEDAAIEQFVAAHGDLGESECFLLAASTGVTSHSSEAMRNRYRRYLKRRPAPVVVEVAAPGPLSVGPPALALRHDSFKAHAPSEGPGAALHSAPQAPQDDLETMLGSVLDQEQVLASPPCAEKRPSLFTREEWLRLLAAAPQFVQAWENCDVSWGEP